MQIGLNNLQDSAGFKKLTNIIEKSKVREKIVPTIICRYCLFSNPLLRRIICTAIKITLKIKHTVPTLIFNIRLETYGRQMIGEVPKFAFIDMAPPNDIKNSENK